MNRRAFLKTGACIAAASLVIIAIQTIADEAKKEIAGHIASAMADDGYTIVDAPDNQAAYKANRLWHRKDQFRRNLHMFDVGRTE